MRVEVMSMTQMFDLEVIAETSPFCVQSAVISVPSAEGLYEFLTRT